MIGLILFVANLAAFALLIWRGGWAERLGVALLLIVIISEPLLVGVQIGYWRVGLLGVNLALFFGLWALSERFDRWWLVLVAGFQLIIVVSHLVPLVNDRLYTVALIGIRMGVWALISITLFIGAWEAWAADRLAREGCNHEPSNL